MALKQAKKLLAEAGYDGTPVVVLAPGDAITLKAQPIVVAQQLRAAGFKVDLQATDWQSVVTRRASQKPPKEGGWNMFFTNSVIADVGNPLASTFLGGKGKKGGCSAGRTIPRSSSCATPMRAPSTWKTARRSRSRSSRRPSTR